MINLKHLQMNSMTILKHHQTNIMIILKGGVGRLGALGDFGVSATAGGHGGFLSPGG